MTGSTSPSTRAGLADDLRRLGLEADDVVMVHGALSRVGAIVGGPDALVDALLEVVGPGGTVLSYQDWDLGVDVWGADGRVREDLRAHVPPFDPATARAARDHGILASTIGTRPGVARSGNPGASVAALGARAVEFTAEHGLVDGYGVDSPFARLVTAGGRVAMIGAPLDTMTLLHHAEALADVPGKKRIRIEYPMVTPSGVEWRWAEEFDTDDPVVEAFPDDFFARIVEDYLATGAGRRGRVGRADSVLVDAAGIVPFAVEWIEARAPRA